MTTWTLPDALALCRAIEAICPAYGCHVALTGGLLYKDGPRKDADLLFYRIREVVEIDIVGLLKALESLGVEPDIYENEKNARYGDDDWCLKAWWQGKPIDMFFPEDNGAVDHLPEPAEMGTIQ